MTRPHPAVELLAPLVLAIAVSAPAAGQCEIQKFIGTGVKNQDQFAFSLAADELMVVSGCFKCDDEAGEAGTVFVHDFDGYGFVERSVLTASDAAPFDHMGWDVAVDAAMSSVVAGAPDEDRPVLGLGNNPGAAYLFLEQRGIWNEVKVTADDAADSDRFGFSVALRGRIFAVGAPQKDDIGAVYIFFYPGLSAMQVQKITPPDPTTGMQFGYSVAFDGTRLAIGARRWDSPTVPGAGKVYVYTYDGSVFVPETTFESFDAEPGDNFGTTVTIDGDHLVVGAVNDDDQGFTTNSNTGVAFYYRRNSTTWFFIEKILPPTQSHGFTSDLALDDDYLLVGAFLDKAIGQDAGAAHVFRRTGNHWNHQYKIVNDDHDAFDEVGGAVALSGEVAVVSADFDDDNGWNAGAAYGYSTRGLFCKPLYAWPDELSLSNGGAQDWTVDMSAVYDGYVYWVLGGLSTGGFQWDNAAWPLDFDEYFLLTAQNKNTPTFPSSLGFLDASGGALSALAIPPGIDPSLAGIRLYHAVAVFDPNTITVEAASNPTSVLLVP